MGIVWSIPCETTINLTYVSPLLYIFLDTLTSQDWYISLTLFSLLIESNLRLTATENSKGRGRLNTRDFSTVNRSKPFRRISPVPMTIKQVQYVLPKGARILVTGANGFLASHTINELLRLGYIVRGTVRSPKPWLNAFYNTKYGPGKFETVIIEDLGNYFEIDSALDEVDGIVHLVRPKNRF